MFGFRRKDALQELEVAPDSPAPVGVESPSAPAEADGAAPSPSDRRLLGKQARKLNLLGQAQLSQSIDIAMRQGIGRHAPTLGSEMIETIVQETRETLFMLLKQGSRSVRGLPKAAFLEEVERDKRRIEAERERAQAELEAMLGQLSERRFEVVQIEEELVRETRESGMQEDAVLVQRVHEMFGGDDVPDEIARIRDQVTGILLDGLQRERDKTIDAQMSEHRREVEKFERRIAKLTSSLELTEEELKRIAAAKGIDPGVASIYRSVQGLSLEEADYQAKQEMMKCIFEANLEIQRGARAAA